jgi:phage baseplate assembly protein W
MALGLYRGFSSHQYSSTKSFGIKDVETVKLDLLSHIFTRKGERYMMPTFGTRIPDMAFEPLDEMTLMVIEEDLKMVAAFDPRVKLLGLNVVPNYDTNTVTATMNLLYVELNIINNLDINILVEGA